MLPSQGREASPILVTRSFMYTHTNLPIEIKPKLVRDKIPEIIEKAENVKVVTRILEDREYGERLIEKIHEETEELALAIREKTNPVEELADVFIYATEMSILLDVEMSKIVHDKLLTAAKKYPVGIVNGRLGSRKYKEIKKKYRSDK